MTHRSRRPAALAIVAGALVLAACGAGAGPRAGRDPSAPPGAPEVRVAARIGAARQLAWAGHDGPAVAPTVSQAVLRAEQAFSLALLRRLPAGTAASPAGLALALAMLQNGAAGRTLDELRTALSAGGIPAAELDAGWAALTRSWADSAASGGATLTSANSLWVDSGVTVRAPFLLTLQRYFGAGVWQVDLAHGGPGAAAAINAWVAAQTHGRITALFDRLPPSTRAVLADALYFHAAWQHPFDPNLTTTASFAAPDGAVRARFMHLTAGLASTAGPEGTAVQLPYRGGRFAALAIMPSSGTLDRLVAGLTAARLQRIVTALRPGTVDLAMPRFTMHSSLDLDAPLQALGMRTAFTDGADFGALSPTPLRVDRVVQRVQLSVGERGTEAAAATGVSMVPTSEAAGTRVISLDHPFLLLVRDTATGAILFAAQVQRPAG